jgi:hypothetical protein
MAESAKGRGNLAAAGIAVIALCRGGPALAQPAEGIRPEERKTDTHGLALSAGLGSQYVGLGFQAGYYLQLPRTNFRFLPYVGFGWALFVDAERETVSIPGTAAGVAASWGRNHRLMLDLFYAPTSYTSLSLHGEPPDNRLEWGPGFAIGYEYAAFSGFSLRTNIGVAYTVTLPISAPADRFSFAGTLIALGYKLW